MCWEFSKANRCDFNRLNELFIEMLQTIYNVNQADGYSRADLDRFFDGRDEWICTASYNEIIIGFLSIEVHHEEEEFVYLDDLAVTSEYRNKGIGTSLIMQAEEYAKDNRITKIRFHVEKSNTDAFRLYRRMGYTIEKEQGSRYLMFKKV